MTDRANCYQCVHRRDLPGSAHSRCAHPAFDRVFAELAFAQLLQIAVARGVPMIALVAPECQVSGDPHGRKHGWFNHPWDFDPAWLVSCTGYKEVDDD